jgi:hypothetical protein
VTGAAVPDHGDRAQQLQAAAQEITGSAMSLSFAGDLVARGWTPEFYQQVRALGEHAVQVGSYVTTYGPRNRDDVINAADNLVMMAENPVVDHQITPTGGHHASSGQWLTFVLPWLTILAHLTDAEEGEGLRRSIEAAGGGMCAEWHDYYGRLGPLAYAAGLTLDDVSRTPDRLGAAQLATLAALRGFPPLPISGT